MCFPSKDFFLVLIFQYLDLIRKDTSKFPYSVERRENMDQKKLHICMDALILFRMGLFGTAHRWGMGQKGPLFRLCHTCYAMMWHSYILPKNIQKLYKSLDKLLYFCCYQQFFIRKQQLLLYQEIQI